MMNDKKFDYEQLERSNFLTWMRISPTEEILDAWRNNREKMRYLMKKYGEEIKDNYDLGKEELRNGE